MRQGVITEVILEFYPNPVSYPNTSFIRSVGGGGGAGGASGPTRDASDGGSGGGGPDTCRWICLCSTLTKSTAYGGKYTNRS